MYVHANLHFIAEKVFTLMSDLLPYRDLGCHFPEFVCQYVRSGQFNAEKGFYASAVVPQWVSPSKF